MSKLHITFHIKGEATLVLDESKVREFERKVEAEGGTLADHLQDYMMWTLNHQADVRPIRGVSTVKVTELRSETDDFPPTCYNARAERTGANPLHVKATLEPRLAEYKARDAAEYERANADYRGESLDDLAADIS